MQLKIKKIHKDAIVPSYAHRGDAGFDVYAIEDATILPNERKMIPLGLSFQIPEGYALFVWDKSGLAKNNGLTNLAGVIDAPFRGESQILVFNTSDTPYEIKKGQKIAQMIFQKVEQAEFLEVDNLDDSERGVGGWGSTGV